MLPPSTRFAPWHNVELTIDRTSCSYRSTRRYTDSIPLSHCFLFYCFSQIFINSFQKLLPRIFSFTNFFAWMFCTKFLFKFSQKSCPLIFIHKLFCVNNFLQIFWLVTFLRENSSVENRRGARGERIPLVTRKLAVPTSWCSHFFSN
jgi:hypothetical protein